MGIDLLKKRDPARTNTAPVARKLTVFGVTRGLTPLTDGPVWVPDSRTVRKSYVYYDSTPRMDEGSVFSRAVYEAYREGLREASLLPASAVLWKK